MVWRRTPPPGAVRWGTRCSSPTGPQEEKEETVAEIHESAGQDIREPLFYALAEKKMPILSMERSGESLEEIFLQLTEKTGEEERR